MRPAPVGLVFGYLRMGELQRLATIDRRQPARAADLAPEVEFLRRLVAGVEQPCPLQPVDGVVIDLESPRLVLGGVLEDAEPMQVVEDRVGIFLPGPRDIGVVEALDEAAAVLGGEQPVEQRRARIADMDVAGGRWGETDGNGHWRAVNKGSGSYNTNRLRTASET